MTVFAAKSSVLGTRSALLRSKDPTRLPADKLSVWLFTAQTWAELAEAKRKAWREWFDWATAPGGELWDPVGGRADLSGVNLDGADLSRSRLGGANLNDSSLRGTDFTGADLTGARLCRTHLEGSVLVRTILHGSDLSGARLEGAHFSGADLSGAGMHDTDLSRVDFEDARLFSTRITEPVWWIDLPRATLGGRTEFPRALPEHPIQDVLGLPPLLRRRIADAQYLRDMYRKAGSWGRAMMWLWGLTCCYGQSLGRWVLCTMLLVVAFSAVFTLLPFNMTVHTVVNGQAVSLVTHPDFFQAVYFSLSTLMTLGLGDVIPADALGRFLVSIQVTIGYLMLGGLLSIFSNKLARLS